LTGHIKRSVKDADFSLTGTIALFKQSVTNCYDMKWLFV